MPSLRNRIRTSTGTRTRCSPNSLLIALVLAAPLTARADDPKLEAKRHVDHATELHKAGKYTEALDELKTAFALDPQPQLLYAMGQLLVSLGRCEEAINYYQRFVDTKPSADLTQVANEAIDVCKTNPPPAVVEATPEPAPPPPPPKAVPPPAPPAPSAAPESAPWYRDYTADGLIGAGIVSGAVGAFLYSSALSDRDKADSAATYQAYKTLDDSAHTKRTEAVVLGALGVGLIAGGTLHLVVVDRVQVAPAAGGATVSVAGRF
jgi:tetratricopeptide (TPR) repeat protein